MRIGIIGLGYVGTPLFLALSKSHDVIGYDISPKKLDRCSTDPSILSDREMVIVCVPTDVHEDKSPNLGPLINASETITKYTGPKTIVVYESTTYPGCTMELAGKYLEDRPVGYSPERINPGDTVHTLYNTTKIISAQDPNTLEVIKEVYSSIGCPLHVCSIAQAEAAKLIENTQRDVNIGFCNEIALYLHDKGIDSRAVFEAMRTKWNALPFRPGLVGGHCIAVDPYYLLSSTDLPMDTVSGARLVNSVLAFDIADMVYRETKGDVLIYGETYKPDVADTRTSQSHIIAKHLKSWNRKVYTVDHITGRNDLEGRTVHDASFGAVIIAVGHKAYNGILVVAPNIYNLTDVEIDAHCETYWRL